MQNYKHILLASDLLENSKMVGERAKQLAEAANAKLSIVHVVEFNPMVYGGGEFAIPLDGDLEQSVHEHAKKALMAEAERLGIASDHQHLQTGPAAENLADLVKAIHADLLVVGHRDRHWLGEIFGSTSNSIMHMMPCDILAVPIIKE